MYEQSLIQIGLDYPQSLIYEKLVKMGPQRAGKIALATPFKRGLVYKTLEELLALDLIEKKEEPKKVAVFEAKHPLALKDLAEKREQKARDAKLALEGMVSSIVSDFNLASEKPGVMFFEGEEGIKKVLEDSLNDNPQKEILCFSDVAGYASHFGSWNKKVYAPNRKRMGIYEKVLIPSNEKSLEFMKNYKSNNVTEVMFIDGEVFPFKTEVNIYNNKVSLVTFSDKTHVGVIIENKEICETFKSIFNFAWKVGEKYCKDIQPKWIENFGRIEKNGI